VNNAQAQWRRNLMGFRRLLMGSLSWTQNIFLASLQQQRSVDYRRPGRTAILSSQKVVW